MKKFIILSFLSILVTRVNAQIFVGTGFAYATYFFPTALYNGGGFTLQVEKDVNLSKSERWKMHPNINVSFLFSEYNKPYFASYLNAFTISPKVSYEVITKERFKIALYANPFASFLLGLRSDDFDLFESKTINEFKRGVEGGLRVDFMLGKTTVRLIPVSIQRSVHDFYGQGMISLLVRIQH